MRQLAPYVLGLCIACTGGNFAGGGAKAKKDDIKALTGTGSGTADGNTGADGNDGPDGGGSAADGQDGTPGGGSGNGTATSGEPDSGDGSGEGDDLSPDGGGSSLALGTDLTITNTGGSDECGGTNVKLRIDVYAEGKVKTTKTVDCPDPNTPVVLPKMCNKGRTTCLKVTVTGGKTQDTWLNQLGCIFIAGGGNTSVIDFDANGSGIFGSCQPGEDDQITLTCDTKLLDVQSCN